MPKKCWEDSGSLKGTMGGQSPIGKPFFLYLGVPFVEYGTILGALAFIMGTDIHMNVANCLDPGPWDPYGTRHI